MSFQIIAARHPHDKDFPRAHGVNVRLSLLNGTFYSYQPYPFHQEYAGNEYIPLHDRAPNTHTGTNQLRTVIDDHVSMLFGDGHFPEVDTANAVVRKATKDFIKDVGLVERMREAARLGSVGSVGIHLKVLQRPGGPARMFVDVHTTAYLTPEYDEYAPDTLIKVTELYKVRGERVRELGYSVPDDSLQALWFVQRVWDELGEWWFVPWKVEDQARSDRPHVPVIDHDKSVTHELGFCPWVWIGGLNAEIDGPCTFDAGIEEAIQLDMLDSQIGRALKYTMDPTLLMLVPSAVPMVATPVAGETSENAGQTPTGQGMAKTPSTVLTMDAEGDAKYLEIAGGGIEAASAYIKRQKSNLIETLHGDRVNPEEVTQGHQGAKSLEMLNSSLLMHTEKLRVTYGEGALLRLLRMALKVMTIVTVTMNKEIVAVSGSWPDLALRWGDFYPLTPSDEDQTATALKSLIETGIMSKETATKVIAGHYDIENVAEERAKVEKEQAAADLRAQAQAEHAAKIAPVKSSGIKD